MASVEIGKGILLKADPIANTFRDEIKTAISACPRPPKLVGILATTSSPSKSYADFTKKQCDALGVEFVLKKTGAAEDPALDEGEGVEDAIIEANEDESVDGIMVYYPIFGVQQDHYLQQIVSPFKDVEGLHFKFHYNLYHNIRYLDPKTLHTSAIPSKPPVPAVEDQPPPGTVKSVLPCTPSPLSNVWNISATVTIINRSEVVGRPLAALLANDGARVFSVDIDSIQEYTKRPRQSAARQFHPRHVVHPTSMTLQDCLAISDVVVSAVPNVREKASLYMPTIGKVTIMMLLRNLLRLQEYRKYRSAETS
ncbi:Methylenetetrahydrofolate dehydrogenase [NAD(+)] [Grifola frondosa]|uniref:Methylenetetrahydrofolate dehydrogenase [NAD(+)] n=1 Tax=Grifola frondosa TaxID=5627 RepID=A0A1C7M0G9_GRIFR|nr:Methylenetetrahydrofolate dehydrogenase [NAD(+)] [Grifola frondosa]